jgi:hypothetical protein
MRQTAVWLQILTLAHWATAYWFSSRLWAIRLAHDSLEQQGRRADPPLAAKPIRKDRQRGTSSATASGRLGHRCNILIPFDEVSIQESGIWRKRRCVRPLSLAILAMIE